MRQLRFILLLFMPVLVVGCDLLTIADGYRQQVVVVGVLEAEGPLPPIRLSWTVPVDQPYRPDDVTISDAVVQVTRVESGIIVDYVYDVKGFYQPMSLDMVMPGATYRLEAHIPGIPEPITAETLVPPMFDIVSEPTSSIPYGTGQGPEATITPSSMPDRQAVYLLQVRSLAPDSFFVAEVQPGQFRWHAAGLEDRFGLTPFYADLILTRDCTPNGEGTFSCPLDPEDVITGSSPLLNEASYVTNPDGNLVIRAPWLAFGYYGPQLLTVNALDDALIAFIESQITQQPGGSTLSPGEIPNVVTNVQGGLGVFGAYASRSVEVVVTE